MIYKKITTFLLFKMPVAIVFFLVVAYGCREGGQEHRQSKTTSGVLIQNGETMLTLDKSAQEKAGIIVEPLKAILYQDELQVYGTVLLPDELIDIRSNYLAANASTDKATAALDASRTEYERLKKLNGDDHNISDKTLQAAGAALASNETDAVAMKEKLQAVKQTAVARWGSVVSGWIFNSSPELNRIFELKDVLIRIALTSDKFIETPPEPVNIQGTGSKPVSARFVSRTPGADPRTQGPGFLYVASSNALLMPGMNIRAAIPVGRKIRGVVIPMSAIVWLQGKAWTYVHTGPEHFARREVSTLNPVRDGYFASDIFRPGEKIVIKGAQILLSGESGTSSRGGSEEEDED